MSDEPHAWRAESGLGPDPDGVREVLAIRPGGLSAAVRAVPALRHLRAVYEAARITVVASAGARELLAACPYVDRFVDIARPSEALVERFDVALSFAHPADTGGLDVADVGSRFRASWREHGSSERGAIHPEWPQRVTSSDRMVRLAWLLGGETAATTLGLWPTLSDRNGAARLLGGHKRPVAAIHVGGDPQRRWTPEGWARVADLVDATGLQPVLVGAAADEVHGDEVLVEARTAPRNLVGATSVGQLAGVLERAALFVGPDSGPASLAAALGVRSVVVGPGSSLEFEARPGLVDVVTAGLCTVCGEGACEHGTPPAHAVPLEAVLARVGVAAATSLTRWNAHQLD